MNTHLRTFIGAYLRVVLGTLFVVASIAFVSMPYALGGHPGEPVTRAEAAPSHMT